MNIKININYIYIAIFALFFFFWGVNVSLIRDFPFVGFIYETFVDFDYDTRDFLTKDLIKPSVSFRLSYLIILLMIPVLYSFIKDKALSFKKIFNYQQYIMFFTLFVVAHYFLVKLFYNEIIDKSEIANLLYLISLSVIYCHYREFILVNFKKIVIFYLLIFVFFSIVETGKNYNLGQCNNNIFIIELIYKYLQIDLTNSIYLENAHLGMMSVAVFFSTLYILIKEKKYNIVLLLLFSVEIIIVLNNLSTTYFIGYFFSQLTLLLFFVKRINVKFWIISVIFLLLNSYIFLVDTDCTKKITDFQIEDIRHNNLMKNDTNLTTLIYQRSIIVAKDTLINHSFGWGIDGMDDANLSLLESYNERAKTGADDRSSQQQTDNNDRVTGRNDEGFYWQLKMLNLKDGLSNLLKLFTEFGIFAFIIYFYFLKYILNIKNINSYNLFIIVLFITLSIRAAGYFSGGFIFCLLEFFYREKFTTETKIKN